VPAVAGGDRAWRGRRDAGSFFFLRSGRAAQTPGVNVSQALNVWIVQAIVAIGPPLGAVIFHIYIKTDWGIPLFFLVPLALVAIPALRGASDRSVEPAGDLAGDFRSPCSWPRRRSSLMNWIRKRNEGATYRARSELARELTDVWQNPVSFALAGGRGL